MLEEVSDTAPSAEGRVPGSASYVCPEPGREGSGCCATHDLLDPTDTGRVTWEPGGVPFAGTALCASSVMYLRRYREEVSEGVTKW